MAETRPAKNDVVGNWRVEKELGAGGQGSVWKVRYTEDKHSPAGALKLCSSPTDKSRARFEREVELLRSQNHPGIVRVRDTGTHNGLPYFVMELATTTLGHVATADSAGTRLILESRELMLRLVRQACEAVAHLHGAGVLHRDIKPNNILLMLDPPEPIRAIVADLGIAVNDGQQGSLTATQETLGTPAFRAPEALGGEYTTRSDVYALGKTIEALFNRAVPVQFGPGKCLRDQRLTDDLWDAIDGVLTKACAFDPSARYEDAASLLMALPEAILGLDDRKAPAINAQRRTPITLSVAERVTLADIIAQCPSGEDRIDLNYVQNRTRLRAYYFSISVRRLEDLAFVETSLVVDDEGAARTMASPTTAGVRWAHEHEEEMTAAIAELDPKPSTDDEIPF